MKKIYFYLSAIALSYSLKSQVVTQTLSYTGSSQTLSIPSCANVTISCYGGKGANGVSTPSGAIGGNGGLGAMASGIFVMPSSGVLNVFVGGAATGSLGGFNGGGNGANTPTNNGGGGGGASDVRLGGITLANRIIVAGGGGGGGNAGCASSTITGGNGGNANTNGTAGVDSQAGGGGQGGVGSTGGAAGIGCSFALGTVGFNGTSGQGGTGGNGLAICGAYVGGGGGGGGFVGGGGGGGGSAGTTSCSLNDQGGGGGGAGGTNFFATSLTSTVINNAANSGNGFVVISYSVLTPPTISVNSGSICTGNFTLTPSGAASYTFQGGSAVVTPTANSTYTVIGTGVNGCISNVVTSSVTVGVCSPAEAINIVSSSGTINLGTSITTSLSGAGKVSVEAWVKPNSLSGLGCIIGNYNTLQPTMQFLLRRNGSSFYEFWVGNGGTWNNVNSSTTPTLSSWTHLAGVWNGTVLSIYVNGAFSNSVTTSISSIGTGSNNPVLIGKNNISENFSGDLDEVRIWNRALCQGEIMNNMNGAIPTSAPGLMANYHFNQGLASTNNATVTSLNDASGNAYTGTLTGMALNGSTDNWIAPGAVTGTVAPFVSPTVAITGTNAICIGNSTTLTANGTVTSYNWVSGPTTATNLVTPTVTTSYSVSGMKLGCPSNMASITVTVNSLPTVSAVTSSSIICGPPYQGTATINASGATTYTWNTSATTSSISASPSVTTTYTVTGTNANGCKNTATVTQSVSACTGLQQLGANSSDIGVYPNPNNGSFTISIPDFTSATIITVLNVIGETILKQHVSSEKTQISLSNISNGIYFVKIDHNQTTEIHKIIKQ